MNTGSKTLRDLGRINSMLWTIILLLCVCVCVHIYVYMFVHLKYFYVSSLFPSMDPIETIAIWVNSFHTVPSIYSNHRF